MQMLKKNCKLSRFCAVIQWQEKLLLCIVLETVALVAYSGCCQPNVFRACAWVCGAWSVKDKNSDPYLSPNLCNDHPFNSPNKRR